MGIYRLERVKLYVTGRRYAEFASPFAGKARKSEGVEILTGRICRDAAWDRAVLASYNPSRCQIVVVGPA